MALVIHLIMDGVNEGSLGAYAPTQVIRLLSCRLQLYNTHALSLKKIYVSNIQDTFIPHILHIKYYMSKSALVLSFKLKNLFCVIMY